MRWAAAALVACAALVAGGAVAFDRWVVATVLPELAPEVSVTVLDRKGALLRAYTAADGRWRLAVVPEEVDPGYLAQLVAFEDRRFATHRGVDALALVRAGWQAVRAGRIVSGGSTLTMQVARLIEGAPTRNMMGKLRQMVHADLIEQRLSKDEILTLYLTLAPYGGNIEGVRAASLAWFGKEPARLTTAEAALLVALPQSPEARRPDRDARRRSRRATRCSTAWSAKACSRRRRRRWRVASRCRRRGAIFRCWPRTSRRRRPRRSPMLGESNSRWTASCRRRSKSSGRSGQGSSARKSRWPSLLPTLLPARCWPRSGRPGCSPPRPTVSST
jgi:membrane carboxypeptidase/penicillin-binding protein PbpC